MLELEMHITRLLLDNDCVIVPNFGGFIAHHVHASYNRKENAFFPPSRTIGFNPQLTMNDSLLAQSYVDTYDISYPEALSRISESVEKVKQHIETKGAYTFRHIGTIIKTDNSKYDFQPCKIDILTPSVYGFPAFEIACLTEKDDKQAKCNAEGCNPQEALKAEQQPVCTGTEDKDHEKGISIHIPANVIHQIAAVCIALVILTIFPSTIGDSSKASHFQSAIDTNLLYKIMPKDITTGKPLKLKDKIIVEEKKSAKAAELGIKEVARQQRFYTIVLASRVTKANAQSYVESLHKKGMTEAEVYSRGNGTKVIYRHFNTKEEAGKALNKLTDDINFSGCWITALD